MVPEEGVLALGKDELGKVGLGLGQGRRLEGGGGWKVGVAGAEVLGGGVEGGRLRRRGGLGEWGYPTRLRRGGGLVGL